MPDFVRCVNLGLKPFIFHSNNTKKKIAAGGEMAMPWDLAATLFGDPFAVNLEKKPDRTDSLRRARSNFNYELGMESMDAFNARRPQVEIYDMETGQRIYMLIEDPDGENSDQYVAPDEESTDQMTLLQRQVAALTQQLTVLINQRSGETPPMPTGQTMTASTDAPGPVEPISPQPDFIGGNPFAQRASDMAVDPLFDFAKLATLGPDELPPGVVLFDQTDGPGDVGVGSPHDDSPPAAPKLAPRPG